MSSNPNYHSYLLRLWRDGEHHPWRASLQVTLTGEKLTFSDLYSLFAYLAVQLAAHNETDIRTELVNWLQTQTANSTNSLSTEALFTQAQQEHIYEISKD